MTAIDKIRQEYERCLAPTAATLAADLYGVSTDAEKRRFYEFRAEGIGYCLDKLEAERRLAASRNVSDIERLCAEVDAADGKPGYHVTLKYPDGSVLDAPIEEVGPDWARFAELRDGPLTVDTADAEISINWQPGPAAAAGPRFDWLNAGPAPKI
jgi:hypothetical protein